MKIAIFSGTTEGRCLSQWLAADGIDVKVFVATQYGEQEQERVEDLSYRPGDGNRYAVPEVFVGRMTAEEMRENIRDVDLCIDATHPYAQQATENIRVACREELIPWYRVARIKSRQEKDEHVTIVYSVNEAAEWLKGKDGNILLTTGAKELAAYDVLDTDRLYPRVLPSVESIDICERVGIPHRNIIAMQGPFSMELNTAMIRQINATYLVTKDSGKAGGFMEKIKAAKQCGIRAIVIARPNDMGLSVEEVYAICRRGMK